MASGNPFGLSELSHYGTMQRVGGKAAGFINKKFFHPSSLRNQEKLWKAQTEDARIRMKQRSLEQQRDEERQVEELKKQMYLRGQGKAACDTFTNSTLDDSTPGMSSKEKFERRVAFDEFKRRKALLKQEDMEPERQIESSTIVANMGASYNSKDSGSSSIKSMYREDVQILGHTGVWGSWFSLETKQWGFACCKTMDRKKICPLVPEELAVTFKVKSERAEPRGKRKRKNSNGLPTKGVKISSQDHDNGSVDAIISTSKANFGNVGTDANCNDSVYRIDNANDGASDVGAVAGACEIDVPTVAKESDNACIENEANKAEATTGRDKLEHDLMDNANDNPFGSRLNA